MGERDTGGFAAFNLKASNGYSMRVIATSEPGFKQGRVVIWLIRKGSFVSYVAPATVTDTTVEADLGAVGKIALKFEPSGEKGKAAPVCQPDQVVPYEKGSYVGEFEFHGEEGFADAGATRLPLSLHPYIDVICGGVSIIEIFGSGPGARLTATARKRLGRVSLQVNQNRPGARVKAQASIDEKRGRIHVHRAIEGTYAATAFDFDPQLRSASLAPPAPFSGSALFRRDAEARNRWTGNLEVDFPGNSDVSLTGAGFEAHLRHAYLRRLFE
ncbi:MAG: hypothetical protein M3335_10850 [Actinomycetota bacterium]|nr:hypothetical protein [Actinomycetota bacterium]